MQKHAIGIDLGTTNSVVAYVDATGRPVAITNSDGNAITPSVLYFGSNPPLIGAEAKEMQRLGEQEVASFFKRSMGDPHFVLHLGGRDWTPTELSAVLLKKLKQDAENSLRTQVMNAVVTVPAYFNNSQREATMAAAKQAGLEARIINEPTAAALAFGLQQSKTVQTVLVYDLGGGTFDVTLVKITPTEMEVIATDGDHNLGGKDWDDRIATYVGNKFADLHGTNPLDSDAAFNDLLVRCEEAKKTLTARESARVSLHHEGHQERIELTRQMFEELTKDLMERTQRLVEQVLTDARTTWNELTGVLLVGGSTRMPIVHTYVTRMSGKAPMTGVNVDEAVALGAAIQAALDLQEQEGAQNVPLLGPSRKVKDVMSHSLGMIAVNDDRSRYINSILIPKNGTIPSEKTSPFKLATRRGTENTCDVYVTQGESDNPGQCAFLGKYVFSGIQHDPSGTAILDISYKYDRNGVVQVSGINRHSGSTLQLTVDRIPDDMSWVERPPPVQQVVIQHVTVYLLIDVSGSMSGAPLAEAQLAAEAFVSKCDLTNMSVGLISFGDDGRTRLRAGQNAKKLKKAINDLDTEGGTDMAGGLDEAYRQLKSVTGPRFIVLLTDGYPNNQSAAERSAKICHADEIQIVAIGTAGADISYLRKLSSSDEDAIFADMSSLVSTFGTIAQTITEGGRGLRMQS